MNLRLTRPIIYMLAFLLLVLGTNSVLARAVFDPNDSGLLAPRKLAANGEPCATFAMHNINKLGLTITNQGHFGTGFLAAAGEDCWGVVAKSAIFPYPGANSYLFAGAFWIGAVVGRDTMVSVGADGWQLTREMWPDPCTPGLDCEIQKLSISNDQDLLDGAKSEQDFTAHYKDTVTNSNYVAIDPVDGRPHIPLNIEITQRSFGWSYSYAEDFILFDYDIKNIGRKDLEKVYMGIYVDGDVGPEGGDIVDAQDDICGFKRAIPSPLTTIPAHCGFIDTINIAWISDNDGKAANATTPCLGFEDIPYRGVTGTRVVRTPSDSLQYSFNWWISNGNAADDFGPRKSGTDEDPFRDFGGYLGTPEGDRNKYYIMGHEEFDYDQLFTGLDHTSDGWLPPPSGGDAADFANGYDTRYLLSFGPFDISPGEILKVTFAYVAGDSFHHDCDAFDDLFDAHDSDSLYYKQLYFGDFGLNSVWASWIYDNPGRSEDGDDYYGKYRTCCDGDSIEVIDTVEVEPGIFEIDTSMICPEEDIIVDFYEGDGDPDFEGARPPEKPKFWIHPNINEYNEGELKIRINGFESETTRDDFSKEYDFEGYRIYMALTPTADDFVIVTSFDREDYNRWEYDGNNNRWLLRESPFTMYELKQKYGQDFDPTIHTVDNLFFDESDGELYYFTPQDWNQSSLTDTLLIHKKYPDEPVPQARTLEEAEMFYPEELTEDGYFKYYEYEHTIRKLLPSQLYYVSVTAFDYGSPTSGLPALETAKSQNLIAEYAQTTAYEVEAQALNAVVYPNPYRADAGYHTVEGGYFEGRDIIGTTGTQERDRRIHFTNLPHKCTIRIFTIDGDLIREIDHDYPKGSAQSMHESWDLITRNTQSVVSGIYYYSIDSEIGNQIGKLVIIL